DRAAIHGFGRQRRPVRWRRSSTRAPRPASRGASTQRPAHSRPAWATYCSWGVHALADTLGARVQRVAVGALEFTQADLDGARQRAIALREAGQAVERPRSHELLRMLRVSFQDLVH